MSPFVRLLVAFPLLLLVACSGLETEEAEQAPEGREYLVYFGTYTRANNTSKGIYVSRLDTGTGELTAPELAAETPSPSFLAIHPNGKFLYSVSEMYGSGGRPAGAVSAFGINRESGKLAALNTVSSGGGGPCHLNVDHTGHCLVVANYGTGSVAAMPVKQDGSLGEITSFIQHKGSSVNPRRQKGPHAHSVVYSPDNRFVLAADLGLDKVLVYRVDPEKATLTSNDPPFAAVKPGSGPRHLCFRPDGRFAYVINEIASTVTAFSWDAGAGKLTQVQTVSTLPQDFEGTNTTAEVAVHPSGRFLYGSNRGHDTIAVFQIQPEKGTLSRVERVSTRGRTPRNFAIEPSGEMLLAANQDTGNVVAYRIDSESGRLTPTGQELEIDSPVCVEFVPLD